MIKKEHVYLCMGSACHQQGSYQVLVKLRELLIRHDLEQKIELKGAFCLGNCRNGIVMKFREIFFEDICPENIEQRFAKDILPLI